MRFWLWDPGGGRLYDDSYTATFFRGWKPLPREIDVTLMTLTPNLRKFHKSAASGQENGQSDQKRNFDLVNFPNK